MNFSKRMGILTFTALALVAGLTSCGDKKNASAGIPMVKPPVDSVTPSTLASTTLMSVGSVNSAGGNGVFSIEPLVDAFRERFYGASGPTQNCRTSFGNRLSLD